MKHSWATGSSQSDMSVAIIIIHLPINVLEEAGACLVHQANIVHVGLDIFDFPLFIKEDSLENAGHQCMCLSTIYKAMTSSSLVRVPGRQ